MRKTRAAYHNADDIVNERLAEALLHKNARDFWAETKEIRLV